MAFPTTLQNPKSTWDAYEQPVGHANHHNTLALILIALQTKVGIDGSADVNSIDYKLNNGLVNISGTQSITGQKTFTQPLNVSNVIRGTILTVATGGFDRMNWNNYDAGSGARRAYMAVYDQAGNWLGNPIEVDNFPAGEGTREIRFTHDRIKFAGTILIPASAGAGKVLTSDASGNATWQTGSSGVDIVSARSFF